MINKVYIEKINTWDISFEGYLDIYNEPEIKGLLDSIGNSVDLCINCDNLRYMDSRIIRLLVDYAKELKENNHNVTIRNLKDYIYNLMKLSDVAKYFLYEQEGATNE